MINAGKIKRNAVKAALEEYRAAKDRGDLTPEDVQMLVMLQDDPTELLALIKAEK